MNANDQPKKGEAPRLALGDVASRSLLKRFFFEWMWPRRLQIFAVLALTGLLAIATSLYPLIIKRSFDTLLGGRTDVIHLVLGAIIGATLLRSVALYLQTVATNRLIVNLTTDLQKHVFAHLIVADFARLTRDAPGQLVSRLTNDVGALTAACQVAINTAVRDSLSILGLVIMMFYIDWRLTLIVMAVYPVAILPITLIGRRLRRVSRSTQSELGGMTALLTEKLTGVRLIKSYGLENYAVDKLNDSFDQIRRLRIKAVRSRARLDPILEALGGMAVAAVIVFAYWRISSGESTVGDFVGFVTALLMAAQPTRGLGNLASRIQEGLAAAERVYDILDERARITSAPDAVPLQVTDAKIEFRDVGFAYARADDAVAVRDFNLTVEGGKTIALVGRSGAGKSTIINLVPRLFDVSNGAILIDGQDIRNVTLASLRDSIALVSQEVTLFDDSIAANIALGRLSASRDEIVAAAKAAAAHDFIVAQPAGYETIIGDQGMRLSGGQRQRLALARAILRDAPILLLDEATSALDTESERLVQDALGRFTQNRTTSGDCPSPVDRPTCRPHLRHGERQHHPDGAP